MKKASVWQQQWNAEGVQLSRPETSDILTLTHTEIANLNDYDAMLYGLPPRMEAIMAVALEGRIDRPGFSVRCTLEPLTSLQIWAVYRREGARLFVGERVLRMNRYQLALFNALEAMREAGADVPARLRAWPALDSALHAPNHARIFVQGSVPRLQIATGTIPLHAMVRAGESLETAGASAPWAMTAHRRYIVAP